MFNLFKKKETTVRVIDKIWMSETAKWNGCVEEWKKKSHIFFIAWFDDTIEQLQKRFIQSGEEPPGIYAVRQVNSSLLINNAYFLMIEHHPLRSKENEFFSKMKVKEITVFSALNEPLFTHFGGERIAELMKQLGAEENSMIEHKMISRSIENAQEKIERNMLTEQAAHSQKEWMERNLHS